MNLPDPSRRRLGVRLTRAAVAAAGVALLVAGLILNLFVFFWSRAALVHDLQVQARIVADNSSAALLFRDSATARDTLASLQASPTVDSAALIGLQGERFAAYRRSGTPAGALSPEQRAHALAQGPLFLDGHVHVVETVLQDGHAIGHIELAASLQPLKRRALLFVLLTGGAGLLALGIAYLLAVGIRRDIDRTEARLDELAFVDPVTGLYNRHAANEHLQAMVQHSRVQGLAFSLMVLDLDDFKLVNDTLGHAVGDDVLRRLADRLRMGLKASDQVFRFGGDEFVVVSAAGAPESDSERLGRAAMQCLQAALAVGGHELYVRGSVGIARFPQDADDAHELLRAADTAMYCAKAAGKNTYAVFEPAMAERSHSRLRIDAELHHAIQRDELVLHYQPIVSLADGRLVGVEALVRWQHPRLGLLQPGEFIHVAEATGVIVELGAWVLRAAARQLARWQADGAIDFYVAVNVSGRQIKRAALLPQVEEALQASGADPRGLEIEITEHTLVEDVEANVRTLTALRRRGLRISVDDFGTGLSSLAYLKRLPIDKFKVDRSFVRELPDAAGDVAIVTAVISMARALGLQVVAEGVENESQRELLARLGCDYGQGYWFGKPLPAGSLAPLLAAAGGRAASTARPSSITASA
jgi:diguanylate cyclase (GGDEF)-like protein